MNFKEQRNIGFNHGRIIPASVTFSFLDPYWATFLLLLWSVLPLFCDLDGKLMDRSQGELRSSLKKNKVKYKLRRLRYIHSKKEASSINVLWSTSKISSNLTSYKIFFQIFYITKRRLLTLIFACLNFDIENYISMADLVLIKTKV